VRVLIAEDDRVSRRLLEATLTRWSYEVISTADGCEALAALGVEAPPPLAIFDLMMPCLDGIELCRLIRQSPTLNLTYVLLLTTRSDKRDLIEGLRAGADDYLAKPYDHDELRARLQVGERVIALQQKLAARVSELEAALSQVKQLRGLLPICSYCKRIRDDQNYWEQVDSYIAKHSAAQFSHGICPDCYRSRVRQELAELKRFRDNP
jgi:DNA-binding response OmpR family regulator